MSKSRGCIVCGRRKNNRYVLCKECYEKYGQFSEWPRWLHYLRNQNDREKYYDAVWQTRLLPYFDDEEECNLVPDAPLKTREWEGCEPNGVLPYAPYDNKDDNIRYRAANGIEEIENETNE